MAGVLARIRGLSSRQSPTAPAPVATSRDAGQWMGTNSVAARFFLLLPGLVRIFVQVVKQIKKPFIPLSNEKPVIREGFERAHRRTGCFG
jgi:hypothetical protein